MLRRLTWQRRRKPRWHCQMPGSCRQPFPWILASHVSPLPAAWIIRLACWTLHAAMHRRGLPIRPCIACTKAAGCQAAGSAAKQHAAVDAALGLRTSSANECGNDWQLLLDPQLAATAQHCDQPNQGSRSAGTANGCLPLDNMCALLYLGAVVM